MGVVGPRRNGRRVPMQDPLPAAEYFVLVGRTNRRPVTDVWRIQLRETLPTRIPVPLLKGDADVHLDLQRAMTSVSEGFGHRYLIDYSQPPKVPLAGKGMEWARECLRVAGIDPF